MLVNYPIIYFMHRRSDFNIERFVGIFKILFLSPYIITFYQYVIAKELNFCSSAIFGKYIDEVSKVTS